MFTIPPLSEYRNNVADAIGLMETMFFWDEFMPRVAKVQQKLVTYQESFINSEMEAMIYVLREPKFRKYSRL
jgi:hypothetical protein